MLLHQVVIVTVAVLHLLLATIAIVIIRVIVDHFGLRDFARLFLFSLALFLSFIVDLCAACPRGQTNRIVQSMVQRHATRIVIEALRVAVRGRIAIIVLIRVDATYAALRGAKALVGLGMVGLLLRIVKLKWTTKHRKCKFVLGVVSLDDK